jgi:hypothetical protein
MKNQIKECEEFITECKALGEKKIKQEELEREARHARWKKENLEIAEKLKVEFPTLSLYDELWGEVEICGHNFRIKKDLQTLLGGKIEIRYYLSPKNHIYAMIFNKADFGEYLSKYEKSKAEANNKKTIWDEFLAWIK